MQTEQQWWTKPEPQKPAITQFTPAPSWVTQPNPYQGPTVQQPQPQNQRPANSPPNWSGGGTYMAPTPPPVYTPPTNSWRYMINDPGAAQYWNQPSPFYWQSGHAPTFSFQSKGQQHPGYNVGVNYMQQVYNETQSRANQIYNFPVGGGWYQESPYDQNFSPGYTPISQNYGPSYQVGNQKYNPGYYEYPYDLNFVPIPAIVQTPPPIVPPGGGGSSGYGGGYYPYPSYGGGGGGSYTPENKFGLQRLIWRI